jgi:transcriptional regulator with XRE-family HTH domain
LRIGTHYSPIEIEGYYIMSNELRTELLDQEYAQGYAESFLNAFVATQIKVIREQRRMTQSDLAAAVGTTQTGISRIEDVNYSSWSIRTLTKLARAFDVRLKVSFEPYGSLPEEVARFNRAFLERVDRKTDPHLGHAPLSSRSAKILYISEHNKTGNEEGMGNTISTIPSAEETEGQGYAQTCSANG